MLCVMIGRNDRQYREKYTGNSGLCRECQDRNETSGYLSEKSPTCKTNKYKILLLLSYLPSFMIFK